MDQNLLQKTKKLENISIELENTSIELENISIKSERSNIHEYPYFLNLDDLEGFNNENLFLLEDLKNEDYEYVEEINTLKEFEETNELVEQGELAEQVKTGELVEQSELAAEDLEFIRQLFEEDFRRFKEEKLKKLAEEEKARLLEEEKAKLLEEEKARLLEEEKAKLTEEEKARLLEEEKARLLEEEKARLLEEEKARLLEEEKAKLAEEEEKKKKKIKENKVFCILYFFIIFISKLENPLIKFTEELSIIITVRREKKFDLLIRDDYLAFEFDDLKKYFTNLNLFLENAEQTQSYYEGIYALNQIPILHHEHKLFYPTGFNKVKHNRKIKFISNSKDWMLSESLRQITNYFSEYKPTLAKAKINALLNDKLLIENIFKCITLTNYKDINLKTLKKIQKYIKKKKIFLLVEIILQRLLFRRILLWKHISRLMRRAKFVAIGKDYKVYRKKIARTYVTNTKTFILNYRKKKKIKCKTYKMY